MSQSAAVQRPVNGFDAVLAFPSQIWRRHDSGPLPESGQLSRLHPALPATPVIGVTLCPPPGAPAVFYRLSPSGSDHEGQLRRWSSLLAAAGWTLLGPAPTR